MKRVLLVNTLYAPLHVGGAERSVQILAESLLEAGIEPSVVCTSPGSSIETDVVNGVNVYRVGLKNLYWPFDGTERSPMARLAWHIRDNFNTAMADAFEEVVSELRPDLVHTNNLSGFSTSVWERARRYELPVVHTVRDYHLLCVRATRLRGHRECVRACADCSVLTRRRRRETRYVDAVVGISRAVLEPHLNAGLFDRADRRVIYNPIRPRRRNNPPSKRPGVVTIGYLGRLSPEKGVEVLLREVGLLPNRAWQLLIAGTGQQDYAASLRAQAPPGLVEFVGKVDPDPFLASLDVLIVPSLWREPMGRTVLEAFAQGIPVIGADRGGIPELIDEGRTGFVFEPNQPGALAALLQKLIEDPDIATHMGEACLATAVEYEPEPIANAYLETYQASRSKRNF